MKRVSVSGRQIMNRWLIGYPERAIRDVQDAYRLAEELKHPQTTVIALWFAAWIHCQRGEREVAIANLDRLSALARPHALSPWFNTADALIRVMKLERTSAGTITELYQHVASQQHLTSWRKIACLCVLAELCADSGYAEEGLQVLGSIPEVHRGTFSAPEILRLEGELLLKQEQPALAEAERRFHSAI